jgi:HEAT repeat protein
MNPTDAALDAAFIALQTYDSGSSRAALTPIDDAVGASSRDAVLQKKLERRLITALGERLSLEAKAYICRKLGWMGTSVSVPVLAGLLTDRALSDVARQALELVPGREASRALSTALREPGAVHRIGLIHSLGVRKAVPALPVLIAHLGDPDPQIATAAAAALGHFGDPRVARALKNCLATAVEAIRPVVADACLACAEQCSKAGQPASARALYQELSRNSVPGHIQRAAQRGLRHMANSR